MVMLSGRSKPPIHLPVWSVEVFARVGQPVRALRVFCPRINASIETTACNACVFIREASETAIACAPPGIAAPPDSVPEPLLFLGPDALALGVPVGAVCALHSIAVRVDVPVAYARTLLDRDRVVVVLNAADEVRGILSAARPPDGLAALADIDDCADGLPETAPLVEAIEIMVHRHVRVVFVTARDGHFVGLVTDLDVLRWAAGRRRRARA
jgi:CBS domain protein